MKVQESFNEKSLKKTHSGIHEKNNVSFTGHKVVKDDNGELSYRFYLPAGIKLDDDFEFKAVELLKDDKGNYNVNKHVDLESELPEIDSIKGKNYIQYKLSDLGVRPDNPKVGIGYKFIVKGKEYHDSSLLTSDRKWNIAIPSNRPVLEKPRTMSHVMPDLMLPKELEKNIIDFKRTHFNKLGGNIDGIIEQISDIKKSGATSILGTPVIGRDEISSHRYWTTNALQVGRDLGGISKFKQLNKELFKNGMTWVNDGAFVNEGIEGIHFKHLTKWGAKSPYFYWIEGYNFPQESMKVGVIPKKENAKEFLGIKLINAPYKITSHYDENGHFLGEDVTKNPNYDRRKETFIQTYDSRKATPDQINSDEIIRSYNKKNCKNHNDENDYMDSVQPYKIEVKPSDLENNYQLWEKAKKLNPKARFVNNLKEATNIELTTTDKAGGMNLWAGNRDIAKLRFMTAPERLPADKEQQKLIHIAENQVQDNIVQVGQFWTSEIANTVFTHAAQQLKGANSPAEYLEKIKIASKHEQLPESAGAKVNLTHIKNAINKPDYIQFALPPENITEGIMKYPLDAIEFSPSTSSVLGSPYLKKLASQEDQIGKSRYAMYDSQKDNDYKDIPKEFQKTYKSMDNLLAGKVTDEAVSIIETIDKIRTGSGDKPIISGNGNLTNDGKELYGLIASDVAKFVITQGLLNEAASKTDNKDLFKDKNGNDLPLVPDYKNSKEALVYNPELLDKITPQSLELSQHSPVDEASDMVKAIGNGLKNGIDLDKKVEFAKHISEHIAGLDAEKVKVAKIIADKTESGVEWRIDAAKDICPCEDIQNGKTKFEPMWKNFKKFWTHFTNGVRNENPNSMVIGEITDIAPMTDHGKKLDDEYANVGDVEYKSNQETGFTTATDYNYLYSGPQRLYGEFTQANEHGHYNNITGMLKEKLLQGWSAGTKGKVPGMMESATLDAILQAHNAIENQDKPRYAHLASMNATTFFGKGMNAAKEETLKGCIAETCEDPKIPQSLKAVLNSSVEKLHEEQGDAFGAKPFDMNLDDIVKKSKLSLEKDKKTDAEEYRYLSDKAKVKEFKNKTLGAILKPALNRQEAITAFLTAMPGNVAIFKGIGESGWETPSKNYYVQNRNPIHNTRAIKGHEDYVPEIGEAKQKIETVLNLRNDKRLTPLVNGLPVLIADEKCAKNGIAPLYRYNDEKDVFVLLTNNGFGSDRNQAGETDGKPLATVDRLDISQEYSLNKDENTKNNAPETRESIMSHLPVGTKYRNALEKTAANDNTGRKDDVYYEIREEDGKKYLQKVVNGEEKPIEMEKSYLFLYREENSDNNKKAVGFGRNPHVKIANAKFNIPAAPQNNIVQLNKAHGKTKACV